MPIVVDNLSNSASQYTWGDAVGGYYGQTFVAAGPSLTQLQFIVADWTGGTTDFRVVITTWDGSNPGVIVGLSDLMSVSAAGTVTVDFSGIALTTGTTYAFLLDTTYGTSNDGYGAIGAEYEGYWPGTVADYSGGHFFYNHGEAPDGSHILESASNRTYEDLNFTLTFTDPANVINGTPGNDTLIGTSGTDEINGFEGHDYMAGNDGNDVLNGGAGDDYLRGGAGDDVLDGGAGFDRVAYSSGPAGVGATVDLRIQGVAQATGQGMDTLIGIEHVSGTIYNDVLNGNDGDNWMWGGSNGSGVTGNDVINGHGGNDLISVGTGNHTLDGGSGTDTLSFFGNSTDISSAGVAYSLALQGGSQDTRQGLMTTNGFENVSGSIHNDVLTGDAGNNVLAGDMGNDTLLGGSGNDYLYGDGRINVDSHGVGTSGPITTYRDAGLFDPTVPGGDDILNGGKGDDWLFGGRGNDVLTGHQGADKFVIEANSGFDRVTDFEVGKDKIVFDFAGGPDEFSDLTIVRSGANTVISWGTGDTLTLEGVSMNRLTASDFQFGITSPAMASAKVAGSGDTGWQPPQYQGVYAHEDWMM